MSHPTTSATNRSLNLSSRIPELDGIRGLAIGMVLIHHYVLFQVPMRSVAAYVFASGRLAWSGVDLFFVLSGFLIGGILLEARESTNYFRVFYTRRLLRIVPIYTVFLASCLVVDIVVRLGVAPRFAWMVKGQLPWLPHLLFLQNFWMAARNTLGTSSLSVTWSLAVEEQFYLTLPLAIRFINRRRLVPFLIGGILTAPILRLTFHLLWPDRNVLWFTLMPCRADALLMGVLGAVLIRDSRCRTWMRDHRTMLRYAIAVLVLGLGVLTKYAEGFFDTTGTKVVTLGFTWLAAFYLCLILYSLTWRQGALGNCFKWPWLRWLGAISYGTYLFHELVLNLIYGSVRGHAPAIHSGMDACLVILALGATLLICQASWTFFEKPLVEVGHRIRYAFTAKPEPLGFSNVNLTSGEATSQ